MTPSLESSGTARGCSRAPTLPRTLRQPCGLMVVLALIVGVSLLFPGGLRADVGPKPQMTFHLRFQTVEPLRVRGGVQLQCEASDCSDGEPLEELGPQSFWCHDGSCSSLAYGYATYNQLRLGFSDGMTRTSNVFASGPLKSEYRVTVREEDLLVERTGVGRGADPFLQVAFGRLAGLAAVVVSALTALALTIWLAARGLRGEEPDAHPPGVLALGWLAAIPLLDLGTAHSWAPLATLAIEGAVVLLFTAVTGRGIFRWMTYLLLVNLISQPLLWLTLSAQGAALLYLVLLAVAEPVIWGLEGTLLYLLGGRSLSVGRSFLLSLAMNGPSAIIGLLLAL